MNHRRWTEEDLQWMRDHYATTPSPEIVKLKGWTIHSIQAKANAMRLKKAPQFSAGARGRECNQQKAALRRLAAPKILKSVKKVWGVDVPAYIPKEVKVQKIPHKTDYRYTPTESFMGQIIGVWRDIK